MRRQSLADRIDEFFADKKPNEVQGYLLVILLLFGGVAYFATNNMASEYFSTQESSLNDYTSKLDKVKQDLALIRDGADVNVKRAQVEQMKKMKKGLGNLNNLFDAKLREISQLTYSEKNWAAFLNSLTTLANQYNIKILSLDSQQKEPNRQKVEEVLNINLRFQGAFNNVLKYINSIEQSEMVVDVNGLDMNSTGAGINGDMRISVWGMKY